MERKSSVEGLALIGAAALLYIYYQKVISSAQSEKLHSKQKHVAGRQLLESAEKTSTDTVTILYGTTTGTSKKFATTFAHHLLKKCPDLNVKVVDMKDYADDQLDKEQFIFFILSTWEGGQAPTSCSFLASSINDMANDFRVDKSMLSKVKYAVFGLGSAVYKERYGKAAKQLDVDMEELGAQRLHPVTLGDDQTTLESVFYRWNSAMVKMLIDILYGGKQPVSIATAKASDKKSAKASTSQTGGGCCSTTGDNKAAKKECCSTTDKKAENVEDQSGGCCSAPPGDEEEDDDLLEAEDLINNAFVEMETELAAGNSGHKMIDLEDLAPNKTSSSGQAVVSAEKREMVTKLQRKALTKEGYKIIGSHSAVKLCRWTKNQLRGRGGCYKHSFYGITSYQCMEATPSLACANKCVFCWRHHKNPVGTEWRWKEDDPEFIVQQAIALHVNMIKQMKGVPGVLLERLTEAHTVRHCALSLVGEPIMYPRINEMLRALHTREISSFLVTNAQFPERIEQLDPVTQLYVSVDAATKDSLKAIDRPLFKDFWERYLASLSALKERKQRTVYRMTLVKSWNMEELDGYAELVEYGMPDFIEIKAVTYCGKSDASTLTMQNVPWHDDVCQYAEELCKRLAFRGRCQIRYSIATEHQHSCCILLAREDKFKVDGVWHTWIDYPKFHQLMRRYYETGESFASEDYMAKTPDWAVYQSLERGFDPLEQRWRRKEGKDGANDSAVDPTLVPDVNESGCG